jgi:hypothetical protein
MCWVPFPSFRRQSLSADRPDLELGRLAYGRETLSVREPQAGFQLTDRQFSLM